VAAADLIITGARVHTLDPGRPSASALAVTDGVIAAVGSAAAVAGLRGPRTTVIDADGFVAVPGLVDAHCHPLWGARAMRDADLTGAADMGEALALLALASRARPPGDWVVAHGLRREWCAGPPTGSMLDTASEGRPMFISFVDGHGALANGAALRRAGIDGPRDFADASLIVCDAGGTPTGELREPSAMEAVRAHIPPLEASRRRALYRAQLERMASVGLVAAHVMDDSPDDLDDLDALERAGDLPVRLVVHLWLRPEMDDGAIDAAIARAARHGRRWRAGAVKFFLDGVVDQGTAWLGAPDPCGCRTGPNWPDPTRYADIVARCIEAGLGCATHAIGDRAIRTALDAYEAAGRPRPGAPLSRIEHVEFCDPADLGRFAALGVVASVQPSHVAALADDPESGWAARLDAVRRGWGWSFADLDASGAVLAFGSDWPVADPDPRIGMMWARRRRAPGHAGPGYRGDQAVDAATALRAYTLGPARAAGEPCGGLTPGARADITVFAGDPLEGDPDAVAALPVAATIVAGTVAYRNPDV
jgi:predicted amidohydrolase YtcJ